MNVLGPKGIFTISIDGVPRANMVVAQGLSNIFSKTGVSNLLHTLKVYDDDAEVTLEDTAYLNLLAASTNISDITSGLGGDEDGDYFFLKKTWSFFQGAIDGIIRKVAIFSDDETLYSAALLKDADGNPDPVQPMYAPRVDITYESRWMFRQDELYTVGRETDFNEAGTVMVKYNMGDALNDAGPQALDKPYEVLSVELYSDAITDYTMLPTMLRDTVDPMHWSTTPTAAQFGVYGQILKLDLPNDAYKNDDPIATIVIRTTRGIRQIGFEPPLQKPAISQRAISMAFPYVHAIVDENGVIVPTGNVDAIGSIFSDLINATYNVSLREITYDGIGTVTDTSGEEPVERAGFYGQIEDDAQSHQVVVISTDTIHALYGSSTDLNTYLAASYAGIGAEITAGQTLKGVVDGTPFEDPNMVFEEGDRIDLRIRGGILTVSNISKGVVFDTPQSADFIDSAAGEFIGVKESTVDTVLYIK